MVRQNGVLRAGTSGAAIHPDAEATTRPASDIGYRVIVVRECCASNSEDHN
jgi:nicotinamidase-related amidase